MRICKVIVSLLVSCLIMVVIFLLSAQNSGESGSLSEAVSRALASLLLPDFDTMDPARQLALVEAWAWPVRKTAHATEYGCLAISLCVSCWEVRAFRCEKAGRKLHDVHFITLTCVIAFCISILYACSDEIHQTFIDGRAGQIADVAVDGSGALVGCLLSYLVLRSWLRRKNAKAL